MEIDKADTQEVMMAMEVVVDLEAMKMTEETTVEEEEEIEVAKEGALAAVAILNKALRLLMPNLDLKIL